MVRENRESWPISDISGSEQTDRQTDINPIYAVYVPVSIVYII